MGRALDRYVGGQKFYLVLGELYIVQVYCFLLFVSVSIPVMSIEMRGVEE